MAVLALRFNLGLSRVWGVRFEAWVLGSQVYVFSAQGLGFRVDNGEPDVQMKWSMQRKSDGN